MKNAKQRNFPEETTEGSVVAGQRYITWGKQNNPEKRVCLDQLMYAYLWVNKRGESLLFLFDAHQHAIPTHFQGFKDVYTALSDRFGFDDTAFFEHLHKQQPLKKELWRKRNIENYRVLDSWHDDYEKGFELQSPDKAFIDWDTPYKEVMQPEYVFFEGTPYQNSVGKFRYPIRVGNLILEDAIFFKNENHDAPVLHFYAQCFDKTSTERSYNELKELFINDFAVRDQDLAYERRDQKNYSFKAGGISFNIVYTFDSDWQFDGGYTSLQIRNNRNYPSLWIDKEYEKNISVDTILQLPEAISTPKDVKADARIKRRPPQLPKHGPPVIWVDRKNKVIGFSDQAHALKFDENEVTAMSIQNVLPAKGPGGAYLEVILPDKRHLTVFYGKCYVFDAFKDRIADLLQKKEVIEGMPYHDC